LSSATRPGRAQQVREQDVALLEAPLIDLAHDTHDQRGGRHRVERGPVVVHQETVERGDRPRGWMSAFGDFTLRIVAARAAEINTALA
jgi:hypothetical protein